MLPSAKMKLPLTLAACLMFLWMSSGRATAQSAAPDGGALYQTHCAACHDNGAARAPDRETLKTMLPTRVLAAMETGPMISMATGRSVAERRAIAEFVTGKTFANAFDLKPPPQVMCMGTPPEFNPASGARWNGWGVTTSNARFQEAPMAGLTAADVRRLQLKWAFAFPGDLQSNAQSTIAPFAGADSIISMRSPRTWARRS